MLLVCPVPPLMRLQSLGGILSLPIVLKLLNMPGVAWLLVTLLPCVAAAQAAVIGVRSFVGCLHGVTCCMQQVNIVHQVWVRCYPCTRHARCV